MRYIVDNDLHIHSNISLCSKNPEQTPENILKYAEENGLKTVCLTNHFWDEKVRAELNSFYEEQNFEHIKQALPLPQSERVRFLFGCEADMDRNLTLGISRETFDKFDFVIVSLTHFHIKGVVSRGDETVEERIQMWIDRVDKLLSMELPFKKIGLGHLTTVLMHFERYLDVIAGIPDEEYRRVFSKAARLGVGIELNFNSFAYGEDTIEIAMRPYRIAKECGCKFYFGSDAHWPEAFENAKKNFENIVDILGLEESDKFII